MRQLNGLIKAMESINFNSVAVDAGIGKATFYTNPEICERVESLREQQPQVPNTKSNQAKGKIKD
ncbi:hypothetical protein ACFC0X_19080 [Paenibacillus chitinolyticus]|uniref:hypothetical protein n=1 Tax=Paenibacillus chitinolyticus TaxID=79263 RepID=UPI0035DA9776